MYNLINIPHSVYNYLGEVSMQTFQSNVVPNPVIDAMLLKFSDENWCVLLLWDRLDVDQITDFFNKNNIKKILFGKIVIEVFHVG